MNRLSRRAFGTLLLGAASTAMSRKEELDSRPILAFLDAASAAGIELHGLMLYRHGKIVAEGFWWPYRIDRPHMMHSLTKSVTACGVGLALAERRFTLDDPVADFFRDELPSGADPRVKEITVRDLLTMQTGHGEGVSGSVWRRITTSWVTEFFKLPIVNSPGSTFVYNSASSFMLSALITKTTGQSLRDYLEPRFFRPTGIHGLEWDVAPGGINPGGNGLSWSLAASLKLGIVHLQRGAWRGRQVLPESWVTAATRPRIPSGRYGYQWWMGPGYGAYYALGLFGQISVVFPEHDAVLAVTAATQEDALMKLIWQHFPAALDSSLRSDFRLLPALTASHSRLASQVSGRTFVSDPNEDGVAWVRFDFSASHCEFRMRDSRGEHVVRVGLRDWLESQTSVSGASLHHQYEPQTLRVVAGGRWVDERTFEMTWQFVETAFRDTVVCRFEADTLTLDRSVNINSGPTKRPTLVGRIR